MAEEQPGFFETLTVRFEDVKLEEDGGIPSESFIEASKQFCNIIGNN
mgnify:CR=1 FL=1